MKNIKGRYKMQIELDFMDALHLSSVLLVRAKKDIKNYKYYSYNPEVADIFRQDALREFKMYKKIKEVLYV